jgi:hypothetical protein
MVTPVEFRRDDSGPLEVLWLDNGSLRLGLVPALGGRVLSVRFGATELLWRNEKLLDERLWPVSGQAPSPNSGRMGDWVNYGGDKTWPAPQGWDDDAQWAGPPDQVLDSGPYAAAVESVEGGVVVTMTSGDDPRTGLRLTRMITLLPGQASYRLALTATNISGRPVRWALWNVTQLPGGGDVHIGLVPEREPGVVDLVAGTGNPEFYYAATDLVVVPRQEVVGKVGFPGSAGWVSYRTAEATLTQSFTVDPAAEYPDSGSPLEVWLEHPLPRPLASLGGLNPPAHIVECEVLGPLTELEPGGRRSLEIVIQIAGPARDQVSEDC